jgi:hypothetical protein
LKIWDLLHDQVEAEAAGVEAAELAAPLVVGGTLRMLDVVLMPCYVPGLLRLATDAQAHTEQLAVEPPPPPPFDNGAVSGSFSVIQLSVWLPVDQIATEMAPREEATPAHSPTRPPRRQSTSTLPTPTLAFYPFHPLTPASPPPPSPPPHPASPPPLLRPLRRRCKH